MRKSTPIRTQPERRRLLVRDAPYGWDVVDTGVHLGFRRIEGSEGSWVARVTRLKGDRGLERRVQYRTLGPVSKALSYAAAFQAAREWAQELRQGTGFTGSVWDVAQQYMTDPKVVREKSDAEQKDILKRFRRIIEVDPIGSIPANDLTAYDLRDFRNRLIDKGLAGATINRELSALRALLSWGFDSEQGLIATDRAWRPVKLFRGVEHQERPALTMDECRRLIDVAEPEVANVVRALLHTGFRPGPTGILSAVRSDYEPPKGNRTHGRFHGATRKGGRGGKSFYVELTPEGDQFFNDLCRDKLPNTPLFPGPGLKPWKHARAFNMAFARAVKAAGLPETTVPYQLRHTAISQWIAKGVSVTTAARWTGTSIDQIDATYGQLVPETEIHKLADHTITGA